MTRTNDPASQTHQPLIKRMIVGAAIGLLLISLFLLLAGEPDPEWGKPWILRPLIIVPLAGAIGGLCNYFIMLFHNQFGANRILAIIVSAIIFIIGLWLGIILGLDGTMWD